MLPIEALASGAISGTRSLDELEHGVFLERLASAPNSTDSALKNQARATTPGRDRQGRPLVAASDHWSTCVM